MPGRRDRRFRAFCVGLPKTGTTSVGAIFGNYRSWKVPGSELERLGLDFRAGTASREAVRAFVLHRDEAERLELDPASANWMVLDVLLDQYPEAKFILTIRDCFSWCDSLINVLIGHDPAEIGNHFVNDPELFRRLLGCELDWFRDVQTVVSRCGPILDGLLPSWARQATTALQCPPARTLIVRTHELSASLGLMADFVGVPAGALLPERAHSRRTARKLNVLQQLDRAFLESAFAAYAGSDIMRQHFPTSTLESFLRTSTRSQVEGAQQRGGPKEPAESSPTLIASPESYPVGYWLRRAEAAAARGDRAAAERGLAEASAQALEPAEQALAEAIRSALAPQPGRLEKVRGHREMVEALAVARALAPDLSQRFGYRLERCGLHEKEQVCQVLLGFAGARRLFVIELGLRDASRSHWLASARFAISYRRETPVRLQCELQLAQLVLDAVERQVRGSDADGEAS